MPFSTLICSYSREIYFRLCLGLVVVALQGRQTSLSFLRPQPGHKAFYRKKPCQQEKNDWRPTSPHSTRKCDVLPFLLTNIYIFTVYHAVICCSIITQKTCFLLTPPPHPPAFRIDNDKHRVTYIYGEKFLYRL